MLKNNRGDNFLVQLISLIIEYIIKTMSNVLNHDSLTIKIYGRTFSHVINTKKETNEIGVEARRARNVRKAIIENQQCKKFQSP